MQNNKLTFSILTITTLGLFASCSNTNSNISTTNINTPTDTTTITNTSSTSSASNTINAPATNTTSTIANVTSNNSFSKSTTYTTDHGKHQVTATFDITTDSDGKITTMTAVMNSGDRKSDAYIARFNQSAKSQIIGKKISELSNISAIGGASDTTDAFISVLQNM